MIRHFQKKFILFSTTALILVLVTIVGSITSIAYLRSRTEVHQVLTLLADNGGQLNGKKANSQQPAQQPFIGSHFTREGMYQYRYFSARIPKGKGPIQVDSTHILTVQPAAIATLANKVSRSNKKEGSILYHGTRYAYKIKKNSQGTQIYFLDESLLMSESREILRFSVLLGIIACLLYTGLLIIFSRRAIRPIIEAEKRQREFITNAGHELKTPLTVISANTEMQEMTTGEDEWTKSNKEQVQRLTRLINNLISMARMQEQPDIKLVRINASDITKRVGNSFKSITQKNGHQFRINIQNDLFVYGDEGRFEELINILLDNAQKYCDDNGMIALTLNKSKRTKNVYLTVSNSFANGDSVDFNKFFSRFYRADTSHHIKKKSGFGIGLSMAQNIVNNFHGKIKATYKHKMISFHVSLKGA